MQLLFLAIGPPKDGSGSADISAQGHHGDYRDYLSMAFATDRVQPSAAPNSWNIGKLTAAGVILGPGFLAFCARNPCRRKCKMHLDIGHLRTLCVVAIVFGG